MTRKMIADARECFQSQLAKDRPFNDAFNNAIQEFIVEISMMKEALEKAGWKRCAQCEQWRMDTETELCEEGC